MDELLEKGIRRLEWAERHMPVLGEIRKRFLKERPFKGMKISMALHVEAKTGVLVLTLADGGADVAIASCNPLSTDDSVAYALRKKYNMNVHAKKGETQDEYYSNLNAVLNTSPDFIIDDGADLITLLHTSRKDVLANIKGANEETTTGVIRLRAMANNGELKFPVMAVNDAKMKFLFDNRYGTGQSTFDGWMNATNLVVAGKKMVVAGYGWCGKGIAMRAKGLGASVIVTEVDPVKAIEAKLDGFDVMPMSEAVVTADAVLTVTGCKGIITKAHFKTMKNGCVLGNVGHFDNEIDVTTLRSMSSNIRKARDFVDEYTLSDGRTIYLIADGRLMNLAAGQGHPAEIMDTSFAIQALSMERLTKNYKNMANTVHVIPEDLDSRVAEIKLSTMGVKIDKLSDEQTRYLNGWEEGT